MNSLSPFDSQIQLLSKVLDLRAEKAQVISSNIANAETPGYSPATFDFQKDLTNAIKKNGSLKLAVSNSRHISLGPANFDSVVGKITRVPDKTGIGDENGVSLTKEMMALSENQIMYEASTQLIKKKISFLKQVLSER